MLSVDTEVVTMPISQGGCSLQLMWDLLILTRPSVPRVPFTRIQSVGYLRLHPCSRRYSGAASEVLAPLFLLSLQFHHCCCPPAQVVRLSCCSMEQGMSSSLCWSSSWVLLLLSINIPLHHLSPLSPPGAKNY